VTETVHALFAGPGELPALCRGLDWSATALGPFECWPPALESAIRICLDTQTIPMAIWAGRDLTLIYNDAYAALLGPHKHPAALGRAADEVWPELWDRFGPDLRHVMVSGESVQHQDARVPSSQDGPEAAFMSYAFTPIRDEHGAIIAVFNVLRDTTARVQAAAQREDFLSWALTNARIGARELDLAGLSGRRSAEHDQVIGYDRLLADWTHDTFLDQVVPEDRDAVAQTLRRAAELGTDWSVECRIRQRDGERRWVWAAGRHRVETGNQGAPTVGIVQDITDRKETEERLRVSEALARERLVELEALYETAPIGLCVLDDQLRWVRANKVIAELNGRPVEDHIGRTPMEVLPDIAAQVDEAFRTILRTGERLDFEITGVTASQPGVERSWSEHWVPIKDPTGQITGISVAAEEITDRKRAASALAESEERFRTLADNIAQFAWMADETGSIFWYNKRWYDYTGTTLEEMAGWGWVTVHHPDHVDGVVDRIRRSFATGERWEDTFPLRGKDGTYRWFLSRAVPIRNASGQVVRWFGTNTDITEQRAAEEALRASERRYRTLAENAPEAIARFDRELRYTYVNEYGARQYGLSPHDMIGRTDAELGMDPARAAFWKEQFEQAAATGQHRSVDVEFDAPGLGHQYLATVLVPEAGGDFSILAITRDVTRLKRAETSLRESEARFRRLADAMPQFVWTARADGTIDFCNERAKAASGDACRKGPYLAFEDAVHDDDLEPTIAAWRRAVQEGSTFEVTHRLMHADGSTHWYLSRGIPFRDRDGRVVEWFGTTTDIDDQKRTEEALRGADREKNEFLAMLSHDLRNPFSVIRTSLALLERTGADSPHGRHALAILGRQVNQMGRLLDDLLDMTRIAKGKLPLKREPLELNLIVRAIGEDHGEVFGREGIDFQVIVPTHSLCARVDGPRLTQALGNLLQNAAKFTPEGGRVTLSLRASSDSEALIEVSDNGAGIEPDLLGRLFDPLVQAHRTLHHSRGGLGLGLALVKGIVELHGGRVSASSEGPGRGAAFTIHLPLENDAPPRNG
jgi:PAS domain S-box-containing protein